MEKENVRKTASVPSPEFSDEQKKGFVEEALEGLREYFATYYGSSMTKTFSTKDGAYRGFDVNVYSKDVMKAISDDLNVKKVPFGVQKVMGFTGYYKIRIRFGFKYVGSSR